MTYESHLRTHGPWRRLVAAALIGAAFGSISIALIDHRLIAHNTFTSPDQTSPGSEQAVYAKFARDEQSLMHRMTGADPALHGGPEQDRVVRTVESGMGDGLATVDEDCAQVAIIGSHVVLVDALNVVGAALNVQSVLYSLLGEVDEHQPTDDSEVAEQQNQFTVGVQVEATQMSSFAIDAMTGIGVR